MWKRREDPEQNAMTASLAASFRTLFPLIAAVAALAVVGSAVIVWMAGYGLPAALGLLIGGLIALIALFGLVAIQIDNNELLAVIAEAVTDPRAATDMRAPEVAAPAPPRNAAEFARTADLARAVVGRAQAPAAMPASISEPRPTALTAPQIPAAQHRTEARPEICPVSAEIAQPRLTVPPAPQAIRSASSVPHAAPPSPDLQRRPVQSWGRAEPVLTARRG